MTLTNSWIAISFAFGSILALTSSVFWVPALDLTRFGGAIYALWILSIIKVIFTRGISAYFLVKALLISIKLASFALWISKAIFLSAMLESWVPVTQGWCALGISSVLTGFDNVKWVPAAWFRWILIAE
jgi:hypothetical protein